MKTALGCVLSMMIIGTLADMSTYKEVHPTATACTKKCFNDFMGDDLESKTKCESCCAGCNFMSAIGLVEVNDEVKKDEAKKTCYSTCDSEKKEQEGCYAGCDTELTTAVAQLKDMDLTFDDMQKQMAGIGSMFNSLLGGLGLPSLLDFQPLKQEPSLEWVPVDQGRPVVEISSGGGSKTLDDLKKGQDAEEEPEMMDDKALFDILKEIGIIEDDSKNLDAKASSPKNDFLNMRELDNGEEASNMAYLRGIWQDRNTMQILLIASITACLFAILWMLCNSSNDPVVRRVAPTPTDEKPPSYSVIYGGQEEKKFPILVVAGIEDEADELPKKVPLGFSTQI